MSTIEELLFRPFESEKLSLPNRIVMAPMTRNHSPNWIPEQASADYYQRRAAADTGLIITEGTPVNHIASNGYDGVPRFFGDGALAAWKNVVDAVHEVGGKIMPQIWHVGSMRKLGMAPDPKVPGYAPSGMPMPGKLRCHAMTDSDIADVIEAFAQAAEDAERLGFDGVEVHGAHGYLIDQFFWEGVNVREDKYGGDFVARTRFAVEIIEAIRKRVSDSFPLLLRYSQWKQQDYNHKITQNAQELERFLEPLTHAGVDIFHCSTRRFWEAEFEGSDLNLAGWTKKLTGKPTITVGSVGLQGGKGGFTDMQALNETDHDFDKLAKRLENDEFDLVAVGRALLGDPEWSSKMKAGNFAAMKPYSMESLNKLY
jgi:2,4-dienoyl-CoA reductase-like NADH-dependent reductase (Old Yellow Enzyme family)